MGRDSSDSEYGYSKPPTKSPSLSTRRKRRKTRRERERLFSKNRHQEDQDQESKPHKTRSKRKTERRTFLANLAIPMIRQNVSTITSNRLTTKSVGLFDKKKTSNTVARDWKEPEHIVHKTRDDLHKILDLEDSGLRKPVDIHKLKQKRFKPTGIRNANKDSEKKGETTKQRKKAEKSSVKQQTTCTVSSESSISEGEEDNPMDIDDTELVQEGEDQFPNEPDFGAIVEKVQGTLRAKNHFGDRDLVREICSRLRTIHKANSPMSSVEKTPSVQQNIPIKAGSISSEIVKRDSFEDSTDGSKSDSDLHVRSLKTGAKRPISGSSSSKRRIQLRHSKPPSEEQLPLTHTIPQITVDALSDAKYLLHLNDNPKKVYQQGTDRGYAVPERGYMESRVKAHQIRRALAPLTSDDVQRRGFAVEGTHSGGHEKNRFPIQPHAHRQVDYLGYDVPYYYNAYGTSRPHSHNRTEKVMGNYGGSFESTSFIPQQYSNNVIASNQNVVAQYVHPATVGYEHGRFKGHDDPFKCYEDPLYSQPSFPLSSQETFMSTESHRSGRDGNQRYSRMDEVFPDDGGRRQRDGDLLDVAGHPTVTRRYTKPVKPETPSPPTIYPFRLFSRYDE